MQLSKIRDIFGAIGLLILFVFSIVSFLVESDKSLLPSKLMNTYTNLLCSSLVAGCFLVANYVSSYLFSVKIDRELRQWKSVSIFVVAIIISDITLIFSTHAKVQDISGLHQSLNVLKLVGVATSIVNSNLLNHFPEDHLSTIRLSSAMSLFLVITGQTLRLWSQLDTNDLQYLLGLISLCFTVTGTCLFGYSCFALYKPLWLLMNEPTFYTEKLKTEFARITALMIYLFSSALVHFIFTVEVLLATLALQIALFYFLNGLLLYQYQKEIEEKDMKLLERMDLTRYISHEMRTPLNSAAIGLSMAQGIAEDIKCALKNTFENISKGGNERIFKDRSCRYGDRAGEYSFTGARLMHCCSGYIG